MLKFLKVAAVSSIIATGVQAEGFGLGRAALPEEVAVWDIDVRPDGTGLPEGRGDVFTGEEIFAEKCAACHGDFGEAVGRWPVLAGGKGTLTNARPNKTIGSYWPYLSTVYDYINRAMPFGNAQSLEADEIYAITAYLLYLNDEVDEDFELSHENFLDIRLDNEGNFIPDDRPETELAAFSVEPCMNNCKAAVEITARAAVIDVTPEETAANAAAQEAKAAESTEAPAEVASVDPELVAKGEKAFRKCSACHQVGEGAKNRSGPVLNGVMGRVAGAVEGFKYSSALKDAAADGLIWDANTLSEFLTKPKAFLKGTKMGFAGLKDEEDRAAIAAYLSTFE